MQRVAGGVERRKQGESAKNKCDGEGKEWNISSHIHSAEIFSICYMSNTVLCLGNREQTEPSSSGFTFTESMLLILYNVCVTAWC